MATLSKFGVPLGGGAGRGGILQPKTKQKFRVRVVNFGPIAGGLELTQSVTTVDRPTISTDDKDVHSYNSVAYYAGKPTFGTIGLVVRDEVTNAVSRLVGHQIQKQMNHFDQTSSLSGINYKFQMYIETLDGGDSVVLEQWFLEGCFIKEVNYNGFDYSSSDAMMINMTIRFDNATLSDELMPAQPQLLPGNLLG